MGEINIEVEAINFKESVIEIIAEFIKEKFPLDYEAQKEVFQYIKSNINPKSYILSKTTENSEIINEFIEHRLNFTQYIINKLSSKIGSKDLEKVASEILDKIYFLNVKFIDEKISEIAEKIDRIKDGRFENKEEAAALEWYNSTEEKKEEIIDSYKKTLEEDITNTIEKLRQEPNVPNTEAITQNENITFDRSSFNNIMQTKSAMLDSLNILSNSDGIIQWNNISEGTLNNPSGNISFITEEIALQDSINFNSLLDRTLSNISFVGNNLINFSEENRVIIGDGSEVV